MIVSEIKDLLQNMASNPFIEHEDITKCGQCWREKIRSEVANEFLLAGKLSQENLKEMFAEIDKRWSQTELFLHVKELQRQGKSIDEISAQLEQEGIYI